MGDRMYAVVSVITASACVGAFIYFLPDAKPELLPGSNLNTFVKIRDKVEAENAEIKVTIGNTTPTPVSASDEASGI